MSKLAQGSVQEKLCGWKFWRIAKNYFGVADVPIKLTHGTTMFPMDTIVGMEKDWVIFYRGLHPGRDSGEIDKCIDIACNLESSWRSAEAPNEDNYTGSNKKSVSAAYFSNPSSSRHTLRKADSCVRGSSGRVDKSFFYLVWKIYNSQFFTWCQRICRRRTLAINSRPPFFSTDSCE